MGGIDGGPPDGNCGGGVGISPIAVADPYGLMRCSAKSTRAVC